VAGGPVNYDAVRVDVATGSMVGCSMVGVEEVR
jgi:hypothetical protein